MGQPNIVTKRYMQDNARFADICNFFLFDGQQVIKPENLVEKDITELAVPKELERVKAVEKFRDVLRGCCVKTASSIGKIRMCRGQSFYPVLAKKTS